MLHSLQFRLGQRAAYLRESRLGGSSENAWIRKSSSIRGWLHAGEPELLWQLATRPIEGDILEIGTWEGKSTCILAGACVERADGSTVVCVDTFSKDGSERQTSYYKSLDRGQGTFYEFMKNASRLGFQDHIVPIAVRSERLGRLLRGLRFRLAFVDGHHSYSSVRSDLEVIAPNLAPGGVVAFHDVGDRYPGIGQAITEGLPDHPELTFLASAHCLVAYVRRSPDEARSSSGKTQSREGR